MTNLIEIEGVRHAYATPTGPLPVLDGLDVAVPEGAFCAVVGPSGCGKSTLTRLISGLMIPDDGEVWLHGERVKGPRSTVGMAFQNPVLLEWRTILDNVLLPLEIVPNKLTRAQREDVKNSHRAFGIGEHFCLGSHLARLELTVIFEEILAHIRNPRFQGDINWLRSSFIHGIKKMPIAFDVV